MANNITAPAGGVVFATDEVGGVHFPYAKLAFGADDSAFAVADGTGARLPVKVGEALPAGSNNIGIVDLSAASLAALETISIGTALPAGSNVIGGVTVSGSLPLPNGASTEATLAALSAKIAALEAGRTPVAVQALATATRAYAYASGQRLTTSGSAAVRSTAITGTEILVHASVRGFFRVGDSNVTATVGAGSIPLEAGEKFHLQITSGQFVSFIRDGATDGSLTIMPVA